MKPYSKQTGTLYTQFIVKSSDFGHECKHYPSRIILLVNFMFEDIRYYNDHRQIHLECFVCEDPFMYTLAVYSC